MKEKILRETKYDILEFVFKCRKGRVWLSLDSTKDDSMFMNIASACIRKSQFNEICSEVCERIDSVYDIKGNKKQLINMIKHFDNKGIKLSILKLSIIHRAYFDNEESRFDEGVVPMISLNTNLEFAQDSLQYSKLSSHFICGSAGDELSKKIFKLIRVIYEVAAKNGYDIFSEFEGENLI